MRNPPSPEATPKALRRKNIGRRTTGTRKKVRGWLLRAQSSVEATLLYGVEGMLGFSEGRRAGHTGERLPPCTSLSLIFTMEIQSWIKHGAAAI